MSRYIAAVLKGRWTFTWSVNVLNKVVSFSWMYVVLRICVLTLNTTVVKFSLSIWHINLFLPEATRIYGSWRRTCSEVPVTGFCKRGKYAMYINGVSELVSEYVVTTETIFLQMRALYTLNPLVHFLISPPPDLPCAGPCIHTPSAASEPVPNGCWLTLVQHLQDIRTSLLLSYAKVAWGRTLRQSRVIIWQQEMSSKRRLVVDLWMENFVFDQWKRSTILKGQIAFYLYSRVIYWSIYNQ